MGPEPVMPGGAVRRSTGPETAMSSSRTVRCPLCGHVTPHPASREFIICTCGLRVACERLPSSSGARLQAVFGLLALVALLGAAADLLRRLW
jgi:hypothetical protein